MRAKFGRGPTSVSKKVSFKFISRPRYLTCSPIIGSFCCTTGFYGFHYCILCSFDLVRQHLSFALLLLLFNSVDTLYMYVGAYVYIYGLK